MKTLFFALALISNMAFAEVNGYSCRTPLVGPDARQIKISVSDVLKIETMTINGDFQPIVHDIRAINPNGLPREAVEYACEQVSRGRDGYRLQITVSNNFVVVKQQSKNARYSVLAYKIGRKL